MSCLFSVVIPTKNRPETLKYALKTCLAQDMDDYEVVVCDNAGGTETKAVVESFASSKIVYRRSDTPLSMQENWNLAYRQTTGKFIIYIGDDDGLMPFALSTLQAFFAETEFEAATWDCGLYIWPQTTDEHDANYLRVALGERVRKIDTRAHMKRVIAGKANASLLPNVYHGAVARSVLDKVCAQAGHVFKGVHPDTFSSFAGGYFLKSHAFIGLPLTITAFSKASGNFAFSVMRNKSSVADSIRANNASASVLLNPAIPDIASPHCVVADSFLHAKAEIFPDDTSLRFDRKAFIERLLRDLPIDHEEEWPLAKQAIAETLDHDEALRRWFEGVAAAYRPRARKKPQFKPPRLGPVKQTLHLDAKAFGVENVAQATELAANILGFGHRDFKVRPSPRLPLLHKILRKR